MTVGIPWMVAYAIEYRLNVVRKAMVMAANAGRGFFTSCTPPSTLPYSTSLTSTSTVIPYTILKSLGSITDSGAILREK